LRLASPFQSFIGPSHLTHVLLDPSTSPVISHPIILELYHSNNEMSM
jgi:hypothetical protein